MDKPNIDKVTLDLLIDKSSKKQVAEAARLLAVMYAYHQSGKEPPILSDIQDSQQAAVMSAEDRALFNRGIIEFRSALEFVASGFMPPAAQQDIFQTRFIDMAEVFASGCEQVLARYSQNDYIDARHYLISLVSDEKAKNSYANWWAPFKRAWSRGEGRKFISIVRKERAAERGKLAGKRD